MRRRWLPLIGLAAGLAGCSVSMQTIPAGHGHGTRYHIQTITSGTGAAAHLAAVPGRAAGASAHSTVIDLPALYRTVIGVPKLVDSLSRDLYLCAGAIAVVGLLNAILLLRLPGTIRKVVDESARSRFVPAPQALIRESQSALTGATPVAAMSEPLTAVAPVETTVSLAISRAEKERTCTCGALIGERSRSGLCRRCAQVARLSRPLAERAEAQPMLQAPATEEGGWVHVATAMISHSRIGERREYYTLDLRATTAENDPVFVDPFAETLPESPEQAVVTYEEVPAN